MKKLFLLFLGAFFISTSLSAQVLVPLSVSVNEDDMPIGNGHGTGGLQSCKERN